MAGIKTQNVYELNWQTSTPIPFVPNTAPSGVTSIGVTGSGAVFYSNIQDIRNSDNVSLELAWSASGGQYPTGTFQVLCSNSGQNFIPLSLPGLTQPSGTANSTLIFIPEQPCRFILLEYTNTTGNGFISSWISCKSLSG